MVSARELVRQCDKLSELISSSESRIVYEQSKRFYKALEDLRVSVSNGDAVWCQEEVEEQKRRLNEAAIEMETILAGEDASLLVKVKKRNCLKQLLADVSSLSVKDGYSVEEIAWIHYLVSGISDVVNVLDMDLSGKEDVIGALEDSRRKHRTRGEQNISESTA